MPAPVPAAVARIAEVMQGFPASWCLCGGWGVDAWLGRQTRAHKDVDIALCEDALDAVYKHFAGWQLLAHDQPDPDSETQWNRRRLVLPAHIHARRDGIDLDIQVTARDGETWILHDQPRVTVDVASAVSACGWGIPALSPAVILFYKALERRSQDEADLLALQPRLSRAEARWLRDAIALLG